MINRIQKAVRRSSRLKCNLMRLVYVFCMMLIMVGTIPVMVSAQDRSNDIVIEPLEDDTVDVLGVIIRSQIGDVDDDAMVLPEESILGGDDIRLDPDFLSDEAGKNYDDYPSVTIRILDKITAESHSFDLEIGKIVKFGSIRIRPTTCKKAPPIEEPESVSFLQIWEQLSDGSNDWVFSGWMFASSPSLSAMDHPVYDVWVLDCKE